MADDFIHPSHVDYDIECSDNVKYNSSILLPVAASLSVICYVYLLWMYFVLKSPIFKRHPTTLAIYKGIFDLIFLQQYLWVPTLNQQQFYTDDNNFSPYSCKGSRFAGVLAFLTQFSLIGSELCFLVISIDLRIAYTNPFSSYNQNRYSFMAFVLGLSLLTSMSLLWMGPEVYGMSSLDLVWIQNRRTDGSSGSSSFNYPKLVLYYIITGGVFVYSLWANFQYNRDSTKGFSKTVSNRVTIMLRSKKFTICYVGYGCLVFLFEFVSFATSNTANDIGFIPPYLLALRGVWGLWVILYCNWSELSWDLVNPFQISLSHARQAKDHNAIENLLLQPHLNTALRTEILYFTTQGIMFAALEQERNAAAAASRRKEWNQHQQALQSRSDNITSKLREDYNRNIDDDKNTDDSRNINSVVLNVQSSSSSPVTTTMKENMSSTTDENNRNQEREEEQDDDDDDAIEEYALNADAGKDVRRTILGEQMRISNDNRRSSSNNISLMYAARDTTNGKKHNNTVEVEEMMHSEMDDDDEEDDDCEGGLSKMDRHTIAIFERLNKTQNEAVAKEIDQALKARSDAKAAAATAMLYANNKDDKGNHHRNSTRKSTTPSVTKSLCNNNSSDDKSDVFSPFSAVNNTIRRSGSNYLINNNNNNNSNHSVNAVTLNTHTSIRTSIVIDDNDNATSRNDSTAGIELSNSLFTTVATTSIPPNNNIVIKQQEQLKDTLTVPIMINSVQAIADNPATGILRESTSSYNNRFSTMSDDEDVEFGMRQTEVVLDKQQQYDEEKQFRMGKFPRRKSPATAKPQKPTTAALSAASGSALPMWRKIDNSSNKNKTMKRRDVLPDGRTSSSSTSSIVADRFNQYSTDSNASTIRTASGASDNNSVTSTLRLGVSAQQSSPLHHRSQSNSTSNSSGINNINEVLSRTLRNAIQTASDAAKNVFHPVYKEFRFKDFCPKLFAKVRQLCDIDPVEYASSFEKTCKEKFSEGRSGAFMFFSVDQKCIVKTTTKSESLALHRIMPQYVTHLIANPNSLVCRFLGAHCITMYGVELYFVVMLNVFPQFPLSERYDLKGSWVNRHGFQGSRKTTKRERLRKEPTESAPLYQDNDLQHKIALETDVAYALAGQIQRDVLFLRSNSLMDYSLLIGVRRERFKVLDQSVAAAAAAATAAASFSAPAGGGRVSMNYSLSGYPSSSSSYPPTSMPMPPSSNTSSLTRPSIVSSSPPSASSRSRSRADTEAQDSLIGAAVSPAVVASMEDVSTASNVGSSISELPGMRWKLGSRREEDAFRRDMHGGMRARLVEGPGTYYIGIIDVLQEWNLTKQMERYLKIFFKCYDAEGISAISPMPYSERFWRRCVLDTFDGIDYPTDDSVQSWRGLEQLDTELDDDDVAVRC